MFDKIGEFFNRLFSDVDDLDAAFMTLIECHVNLYSPDQAMLARVTFPFKDNKDGLDLREQCNFVLRALQDQKQFPHHSKQLDAFHTALADVLAQLDAIESNPVYEAERVSEAYNDKTLYLPNPDWQTMNFVRTNDPR